MADYPGLYHYAGDAVESLQCHHSNIDTHDNFAALRPHGGRVLGDDAGADQWFKSAAQKSVPRRYRLDQHFDASIRFDWHSAGDHHHVGLAK